MRFSSLFCALFFLSLFSSVPLWQTPPLTSSSSPIAAKISVTGISNAGKISDHLYRGAQPYLSNLAELKKLGIDTIVDLRAEFPQTRNRERLKAESLGIRFISIPVGGFFTPSSAQLAEFFHLLREAPPQTVFVHCEFGDDRTGAFIAAYRIAFDHWSADQALAEMDAFGFHRRWHPNMASFVRALPALLHSDPTLKSALPN